MASDINKLKRPPVVVVLGHVDHGKTTLLDYIRKTNVVAGETGGITQGISAYEIEHKGERLTFIDTPGHEAFTKMRSRGLKVADLAILVVAIDDGVQPQTKEAITIIRESNIPFVVALNKIDKEGIDQNRVKNELTGEGVLLEGYGGSVSAQPISAKTGEGVPELLDLLILATDLADLSYDREAPGEGIIIEVKRDGKKGIIATAVMKNGVLKVGDPISAGAAGGKVRGLENFLGKRITEARPSTPIMISGFEELPAVGEKFVAATHVRQAPSPRAPRAESVPVTEDGFFLHLVLKSNVTGSLEALIQVIEHIPKPENVALKIIESSVGDITDGDVQLAVSVKGILIGFKVKATKAAEQLADVQRVRIITSDIIYELVKAIEEEFKHFDKKTVKGDLEILAVFKRQGKTGQIVGGRVTVGVILGNSVLDLERRDAFLGTAKLLNLQKGHKDVVSVEAGSECGLLLDSEVIAKVGDHLIAR
jgi:translation initiation factor IF-2